MKILFSALVASVMMASAAQAAVINWSATLTGDQEVPTVVTTASGAATGTIDTSTFLLSWDISYADLLAPATALHFHSPAFAGQNAGVAVNIGAISGLGSPSVGGAVISSQATDDLLAGLFYINLHSQAFPGGEIRGQVLVSAVPLPAAGAMLAIGLLGFGLIGRRRNSYT